MHCKNCGAEINEKAVVCVKCGSKVESLTAATKISNNLALAIISAICCCLPLGIVSIIYSCKVNTHLAADNISAAENCALLAKKWAWAAIISGFIIGVISFVIQILIALSNQATY